MFNSFFFFLIIRLRWVWAERALLVINAVWLSSCERNCHYLHSTTSFFCLNDCDMNSYSIFPEVQSREKLLTWWCDDGNHERYLDTLIPSRFNRHFLLQSSRTRITCLRMRRNISKEKHQTLSSSEGLHRSRKSIEYASYHRNRSNARQNKQFSRPLLFLRWTLQYRKKKSTTTAISQKEKKVSNTAT